MLVIPQARMCMVFNKTKAQHRLSVYIMSYKARLVVQCRSFVTMNSYIALEHLIDLMCEGVTVKSIVSQVKVVSQPDDQRKHT